MNAREALIVGVALAGALSGAWVAHAWDPLWALSMLGAGLGFGAVSILAYARRLMFAAAASPHAALLAGAMGYILAASLGGPSWAWALAIGLLPVYLVGWLAYRGRDPDEATALMASLTSSAGALAAYYAVTHYSTASMAALVVGDPLLAPRGLVAASIVLGAALALAALLAGREIFYVGVDPWDARLAGLRVWAYDLLLYTMIGAAATVMVGVVGFVLEHALILLPGAIAYASTRGLYRSIAASIAVASGASLLGLNLGVALDVSPAPLAGLILVAAYLAVRR